MNVDDAIRDALRARAQQVTEADLTRADPPTTTGARSRMRWAAPLLAAAAVVGIAVTTAVVVSEPDASTSRGAGGNSRPVVAPSTPLGGTGLRHGPPPTTTSTGADRGWACYFADASVCRVPAGFIFYVPMWPFANYRQAQQWLASGGSQPWHLDAKATARFFVQDFLGFRDLGVVTSTTITADQAHIGIGYRDANGADHTAAVVHLVRYEHYVDDRTAPWEVVGTDDTTFSLERPAYSSTVGSPLTAGGHITGVDENIRVWVRTLAGVVGSYCCLPAGGDRRPWSVRVSWHAAARTPLTVVAVTGGHLQQHERFAIQGLWAGS